MSLAQHRAWLATAYFVPPRPFRELLTGVAKRGVDVRVLMPGPHNDIRTARFAQRSLYPTLHRRGVRLFEYQPSMIHRKVALIDDDLVLLGSINLDTLSLRHLQEGSLVALDHPLAREVEAGFEEDFRRSHEVEHPKRHISPLARLAHRMVHPLSWH